MIPRLGVNIDHIATLRQLRGTRFPDLLEAARICEIAGAKQITVHLREDRRHIQDADVKNLRAHLESQLNLEMAATPEMLRIAQRIRPDWVCLVPEKRAELTTEGGLAVTRGLRRIGKIVEGLKKNKIKVSLFIEPNEISVLSSVRVGADAIEIHTGKYCLAKGPRTKAELTRIRKSAEHAIKLGLHVHAGHGFDYENIRPVSHMGLIEEYNIGHSIVCRAVIVGLEQAVREMHSAIVAP